MLSKHGTGVEMLVKLAQTPTPWSSQMSEKGSRQTSWPVSAAQRKAGAHRSILLGLREKGSFCPGDWNRDNRPYIFSSTGYWSRFYAYFLMKSFQFFYNCENRSSGRLGSSPKATQLVGDDAVIQIQSNTCTLSFPLRLQHLRSFYHFTHENTKIHSELPPTP